MPVDLDTVDALAAAVAGVYREGETALVRLTRDRLAIGLDRTTWQTERIAGIATMRAAAQRIAVHVAGTGTHAVRSAVAAGYRSGIHDAVRELSGLLEPHAPRPAPLAGEAAQRSALAVQALARATLDETRALHSRILPDVEGAYRRAIAGAAARRLSGASSMRDAAQAAWATLYQQGITSYTDRGGRRWRLSTYVEMASRAAITRAAVHGLTDQYLAEGVDLVSVDDVAGECVRCRPFEHQVLRLTPGPIGDVDVNGVTVHIVAELEAAMLQGLFHPNCRHIIRAYYPGRSMLIKQGRTADPAGEAARDRQRYLERQVRYWREVAVAALTDQVRQQAGARVAAYDAEIARHVATHKLTRLRYRETIGAGFIPPMSRIDDIIGELGIPATPRINL
jgi:hypothetical protein